MKSVLLLQCYVALVLLSSICQSTGTGVINIEESDNTDFTGEEIEAILQTVKQYKSHRKGLGFQQFLTRIMGCFGTFSSQKEDSDSDVYELSNPVQIPRPPSPGRRPVNSGWVYYGDLSEARPNYDNTWTAESSLRPYQISYADDSEEEADDSDYSQDYYYVPSRYVSIGNKYYKIPQQQHRNPEEPRLPKHPERTAKCIPVRAKCSERDSHNVMPSFGRIESSSFKTYRHRGRRLRGSECCDGSRCTNRTCCIPTPSGRQHAPCSSSLDCCNNGICDMKTNMCLAASGSECDDNRSCLNTQCTKNICCNPSIGVYTCEKSSECCAGVCEQGKCKAHAGESCQANFQCASNKCLNEFCQA